MAERGREGGSHVQRRFSVVVFYTEKGELEIWVASYFSNSLCVAISPNGAAASAAAAAAVALRPPRRRFLRPGRREGAPSASRQLPSPGDLEFGSGIAKLLHLPVELWRHSLMAREVLLRTARQRPSLPRPTRHRRAGVSNRVPRVS